MYDLLKVLVANLMMPLPVSLGLGLLGLLLFRRQRRWGVALMSLGLGVLFLASWPPVADRLLAPLESRYSALDPLPDDDALAAVVVLGGGWEPDSPRSAVGRLSDSSAMRLMGRHPTLATATRPAADRLGCQP